jgi:predicted MPP superfamily phosphohydrolase
VGDFHYPFVDEKAVDLLLQFIKDFQPDKIFLNGDIIDMWAISRFTKPLHIDVRIEQELVLLAKFLMKLRRVSHKSQIIYIFGNHEFRFEKYISQNAKDLVGLKKLSLPEQIVAFCSEDPKIKFVNSGLRENYFKYGKLLIGHFDRVNKHSAYTAKNLLEDKGVSLIQNHTHRGGASYKRDFSSFKVAHENFCMCNLNPEYTALPNWQLGFSVIHKWKTSDFFRITPVPIIKNMLLYGDKLYT